MWLIQRTKPGGTHLGYAIPSFIRNGDHQLATLDAYADGAIDVWGMVDFHLFEQKLRSRWVSPQPPDGVRIYFHNLGICNCRDGSWAHDASSIREQVHSAIQSLNPKMESLFQMPKEEAPLQPRSLFTIVNSGNGRPCRQETDGTIITGREVPIFEPHDADAFLTRIFIFADGLARIGNRQPMVPMDEVLGKIQSGQLVTSVPDGTRITVDDVGSFTCENSRWQIEPVERAKEIRGLLDEAQSGTSPMARCERLYCDYVSAPSELKLDLLREAYGGVAKHLRRYIIYGIRALCGDE